MCLGVASVVAQYLYVIQSRKTPAEVGMETKGELEAQVGRKAPETFAKQVRLFIGKEFF
ncbi:hypothetical protein OCU04_002415 [Sclerotinia nivalis]|uniref:Uncharacterized protein n=1 Tax=Sclerotinia nivalis TaxID=352851 RepID=A0A9X0DM57_9HELO|nr:hypothetical protein OCU04_002415 [Sclerotinia nivalis]